MRFEPLTDEQIEQAAIGIKIGQIVRFKIIDAEDKLSKAGNEMTSMKLSCTDDEGSTATVYASVMAIKKMMGVTKRFFSSIGHDDWYKTGDVPAIKLWNKEGDCILGMSKATANYPSRIEVQEYIPASEGHENQDVDDGWLSDDIPL